MPVVQVSPGSEVAGKLNAKINRKHGALAKLPTDDSSATFYERLLHFSSNTSLHGWSFLLSKHQPISHTISWSIIIFASLCCMGFIMMLNILEFTDATVTFNLESPTVPLDQVLFPATTYCNKNSLRKSFIHSLLKDPIFEGVQYDSLFSVVEKNFVIGNTENLTALEEDLINRLLTSKVYDDLFQELYDSAFEFTPDIQSNTYVDRWHFLQLSEVDETNRMEYKRAYVQELAVQFRDYESVPRVSFPWYGVAFVSGGYNTDVSPTCASMVPYVLPGNFSYYYTMKKGAFTGTNNGLEFILDSEAYDYGYSTSGNEGFSINVGHTMDIPIMLQTALDLVPGQALNIGVIPTLINTTDGARRRFKPSDRLCYFEDEITLIHFPLDLSYRYSLGNCLYEATLQRIERDCNCLPVNFLDVEGLDNDLEACAGPSKVCMNRLINKIGTEKYIVDPKDGDTVKECLNSCVDQTGSYLLTQSAYPNKESFHRHEDFCLILKKLFRACRLDRRDSLDEYEPRICGSLDVITSEDVNCKEFTEFSTNQTIDVVQKMVAKYARENLAKVNIYVRDPFVKRYLTEEKITQINFVGTVGGLMSLFTGFSFISAVEILYSLFIWKSRGQDRTPPTQGGNIFTVDS